MSVPPTAGAAGIGGRNLVAVLGPTNTGKTHLAIERMLGHSTGVIGLPLRLLAREVYNRVAARVGHDQVALITGEEKILPASPRFKVCTVEAMPSVIDTAFLAIDEIQIAGDLERGHVFTDRMLNLRGREETLLLGAATMRGIVEKLIPGVNIVTRPRMSVLTYSGSKKLTRLPRRSAIVAFSADEVYAIAELIRRQRGGAAVVLGSLSPRTRNAQVELFQAGDVDFLVATDAIGMGLNLDVDHVAFASDRKFDGFQFRKLSAAELAQVAGRAGRHMRDGTFGVTSRVDPFPDELVVALETHRFEPVRTVQWRNRNLDFASLDALRASLDIPPVHPGLTKAPPSADDSALAMVARDALIRDLATTPRTVSLLWDVCQIPDYRKIAPANHAELVSTVFGFLARDGVIAEDWFAGQIAFADRTEGDIDTLANRIAHIRTWTFAANRPNWLADPAGWQERTRAIEDRLSDALHERLTGRFVDRRTSVLMRRLREKAMLEAEITATGDVLVEGQHVGTLSGLSFTPDSSADGPDGKALRLAAQKALAGEMSARADRIAAAENSAFILGSDGALRWQGAAIARLAASDDALKPRLILLADDDLPQPARERVQARIDLWIANHGATLLKPLFDLRSAENLAPPARGIAFRLVENFGVIERSEIAEEVRALDQEARAGLRALGVRFGAYNIYVPPLLKPMPAAFLATCFALKSGGVDQAGVAGLTQLASSGRTSVPVDPDFPKSLYRVVGYRIAGSRAVRIDILERLADQIRPLLAWRATADAPTPPDGAVNGNGFKVTLAMTSLLGCSGEDFASVLKSLGYRMDRRPVPLPPAEVAAPAAAGDAANEPAGIAEGVAGPSPSPEPSVAPEPVADNPASLSLAPASLEQEPEAESAVTEVTDAISSPNDTVAAVPAEPQFIEIWRPGGRSERRHPPRREQRRARPDAPAVQHAKSGTTDPVQGKPARPPRRDGKRNDRDRRPDFRQREPRQAAAAPPPRPSQRPIDPDSPFAALAALKAQLEAQKRDG
jgi:ATP-dependent RNA helicase SUPV3L1/SUV3